MTSEAIDTAASLIVTALRSAIAIAEFPQACRPATIAEGYRIQAAVLALIGQPVAGYKVAGTSQAAMTLFEIDEPFYGAITADRVFHSGDVLPAARFTKRILESEFAFRMGVDLPARDKPYSADEVSAAVAALVPAFEIVSPRLDPLPKGPSACADLGVNGGIVLGTEIKDWRHIDLAAHAVRFLLDGEEKAAGTGALAMGNPLHALVWQINALSRHGLGIKAGALVTTGTMTGLQPVEPGQQAIGDFGPLGLVEASFG